MTGFEQGSRYTSIIRRYGSGGAVEDFEVHQPQVSRQQLGRTGSMRSSELYKLLCGPENGSNAKAVISGDIPAFRRGFTEIGRTAPVIIQDTGESHIIGAFHIRNLCSWFLLKQIDHVEFYYLASAVTFCEDFEFVDDSTRSMFDTLVYPYEGPDLVKAIESVSNILGSAP